MGKQEFTFSWPPCRPPLEQYKTDLGIGIVGFGRIVRALHIPAYQLAGYRVVAAADTDEQCRQQAQSWGVKRVTADYHELLAMDEVQVIDLTVNHKMEDVRLEIIRAAAKAGKAVLVQKPIAMTLSVAEAMVEAAEQGGIPFAVNQNARYGPACYSVKQLLAPERLGRPAALEIENIVRAPAAKPMTFGPQGSDIAWYIHHVDLLRWWAGAEPVRAYAQFAHGASMVLFEFSNGASGYLMEITSNSLDNETPIRVWAEKGAIRANHRWNPWNNWAREHIEFRSIEFPKEVGWVTLRLPGDPGNPYGGPKPSKYDFSAPIEGMVAVMGEFMQAIHEGRPAPTNGRDNLLSLRMCLAAQRSAQLKQPIDPREIE